MPITATVLKTRATIVVAVLTGAVLEVGVHAVTGRREAWDTGLYWSVGLPLACLMSFGIGLLSLDSDWLWTAVIVPSQVAIMMIRNSAGGNLWPLTLAFSALLSAPFVLAAFVGSRFRVTFLGSR